MDTRNENASLAETGTESATKPQRDESEQMTTHRQVTPAPAPVASTPSPAAARQTMTPDQARIELMSLASKSTGTAYLLWLFGGIGGYHRFYLGHVNSAVAMLVTLWLSAITLIILIGFVGLFALFVWWVVDAFLISGWVSERNNRIATLMTAMTQKPHEPLPG